MTGREYASMLRGIGSGLLTGLIILLVIGWISAGRTAYARGWDDARRDGLTRDGCDRSLDSGSPLLRYGPWFRLGAWHDGCIAYYDDRDARPPEPPCTVGCPGPQGVHGG